MATSPPRRKGTIRPTVTIDQATMPEWFDVLSMISSGQKRAELLRSHLGLPPPHLVARAREMLGEERPAAPVAGVNTPASTSQSSTGNTGNPVNAETVPTTVIAATPIAPARERAVPETPPSSPPAQAPAAATNLGEGAPVAPPADDEPSLAESFIGRHANGFG